MIKLTLPPKPARLANSEAALTAEFKADNKKTVWKKDYIVAPLLKMTNGKCAYSEVKLNENGAYCEVEHFKHKSQFPDDVVKWGNLLPSCKTCNISKGTWDVVANPIVNPLFDVPAEHLYMRACRFYKKDSKGENTIVALDLNNNSQFVLPRFRIASEICNKLECELRSLKDAVVENKVKSMTLHRNKIKAILRECLPTEVYSAAVSTYLLYDSPVYGEVKEFLQSESLWDDELNEIDCTLNGIALGV